MKTIREQTTFNSTQEKTEKELQDYWSNIFSQFESGDDELKAFIQAQVRILNNQVYQFQKYRMQ